VPDESDLSMFYTELNSCKTKPVTLSLIHPFSESFVSRSRNIPTIPDLFDKKYLDLEYHDLLEVCSNVNIEITAEERKTIEEDARSQSQSSSFYHHRAGRVGASISKAASHTNPAQPSQSLIKQSVTQIFSSLAMQPQNTVVNMRLLQLKPMKRS